MAVCGRCMICGHKFSCEGEDEAVRWHCRSDLCKDGTNHAICTGCHDGLVGRAMDQRVVDLLTLLAERKEP